MKKQLLIISGVVLAVAIGIMFYFISIPDKTSAALYAGNRTGNYCKVTVGTDSWEKPCETGWTTGSDIGGSLGAGTMTCNIDGSCSYETSAGGSYGGTVGTDVYFTNAHATAFLQNGGTTEQVNAIDGIYVACQNLLASKPVDVTPIPKAVSCEEVKWACRPNGTMGCQRIDSGAFIGNPYHPENTACNNSNGYGGTCGGSQDGLGCPAVGSIGGTIGTASPAPVGSTRAEFDPKNPGFGTVALRKGSVGAEVVNLQKFLIDLGYTNVVADGNFGVGTENAVKAFQTSQKLKADGVVGASVRATALGAYCQAHPTAAVCNEQPPLSQNPYGTY